MAEVLSKRSARQRLARHAGAAALLQHLALEDPDLDADRAGGGARDGRAVVDVGAQRVKRDAALAVLLVARDLGAAEATGRLHADALRAELHRDADGLLHRAP